MVNTLIFDLDGTLVDSLIDLGQTTNRILTEYGFPIHEMSQYRQFVGNGATKLIEKALPSDKKELVQEARQRFDELYGQYCLDNTRPYTGIEELLQYLKMHGYHLAVVTNKPKDNAVKIVNHLFPDTFSYVFGNTNFQPKKPDPCLTNLVIDLFGVKKNEVIFVGDSCVDIETANHAKVKSIGCSWGFRGKVELLKAGASFIVDRPCEIKEILNDCSQ